MNYVEGMIIDVIFLLFPLLLYVFYIASRQNYNKKEDSLFFCMAVITSLYLLMRFGVIQADNINLSVLFSIPLLLSYVKKQPKTALAISVILGIYDYRNFAISPSLIIIEYGLYFFLFYLFQKKNLSYDFIIHSFVLVKTFCWSLKTFYVVPISPYFAPNLGIILLNMLLFYLVAYVVIILLHTGEDIVRLNQSLKDLEKEKYLRTSLFKIIHEIKNPIAVCKGYLDMLHLENQEQIQSYIPIIRNEIARTLTLMEDYSNYTKKIHLDVDIMDLCFLLEDTKKQMEPLLNDQGIHCSFEIPDIELFIMGDYNRLKQVLINLIKNAIEARDEKKEMQFSLSIKQRKTSVSIVLWDNGIGMDKETLQRMSELFFTTKSNGTGLGVALSKEIIELHQGTIHYDSKAHLETTVTITLPFSSALNE